MAPRRFLVLEPESPAHLLLDTWRFPNTYRPAVVPSGTNVSDAVSSQVSWGMRSLGGAYVACSGTLVSARGQEPIQFAAHVEPRKLEPFAASTAKSDKAQPQRRSSSPP